MTSFETYGASTKSILPVPVLNSANHGPAFYCARCCFTVDYYQVPLAK